MKKSLIIILMTLLLMGFAHANDSTVEIDNITFKLPAAFQGGELQDNEYRLENTFSIRNIDDNLPNAIGLWAAEQEFSEDLTIGKHPVRHFSQYNKYVDGDHSHAYFISGQSVYEIAWTGKEISGEIEKLINDTPKSEIDEDDFYGVMDEAYKIYKQEKKDKLNSDAEYNYLESKFNSHQSQNGHDDTRFRQILYTYYLNR